MPAAADVASADQQKPAGAQLKHEEEEEEDIAMDTEEQEEDLKAVEAQELKPEQLESAKARRKGTAVRSHRTQAWWAVCLPTHEYLSQLFQYTVYVSFDTFNPGKELVTSLSALAGLESGELEPQRQGEEEEEESKPELKRGHDEERPERSTESTIHTVPELLVDMLKVSPPSPQPRVL